MSRAHELAWCAGFFDGEGFITIQERNSKTNGKRYKGYYLRIGINHVNPTPLYEIQRVLGGTIGKQNQDTVVGKRHVRHSWQMGTSAAANALIQMMPYFKNKNNVAELALSFQETIGNHGQRVSNDVIQQRKLLKEQITLLNAKD